MIGDNYFDNGIRLCIKRNSKNNNNYVDYSPLYKINGCLIRNNIVYDGLKSYNKIYTNASDSMISNSDVVNDWNFQHSNVSNNNIVDYIVTFNECVYYIPFCNNNNSDFVEDNSVDDDLRLYYK